MNLSNLTSTIYVYSAVCAIPTFPIGHGLKAVEEWVAIREILTHHTGPPVRGWGRGRDRSTMESEDTPQHTACSNGTTTAGLLDSGLHETLPRFLLLPKQTMDLCQALCIARARSPVIPGLAHPWLVEVWYAHFLDHHTHNHHSFIWV